jgi:hypothetical protein
MIGFFASLGIEVAGLVLVFAAARGAGPGGPRRLRRAFGGVARVARRPALAIALSGAAALAVAAGVSTLRPSVPSVHDEFSYLLAADTFLHGRLANPPDPDWVHFETIHVIQQPTYASKYPPLPGLFLALGTLAAGEPAVGAWLVTALAAAALCWMLQGWLPRRWALLGALLFALHPAVQIVWGRSLWGGAPAVLGGALVFGALPRCVRDPRPASAALLALGVAVLANTRPYEGLLAALAAGLGLAVGLARRRTPPSLVLRRLALPAALVLLPCAAAMAHYNARVTGDPLRFPYQVHEATYGAAPLFLFQERPATPAYRHRALEQFHAEWSLAAWREQRSLAGVLRFKTLGLLGAWLFLLGPTLTVPFAAGLGGVRRPEAAFAAAALAAILAGVVWITWLQPHYFAVALPLVWLLVVAGLRRIHARRAPARSGRLLVAGLVGLHLFTFASLLSRALAEPREGFAFERARIVARLESLPGRHLVLVRYGPQHDPLEEWVYNGADLAGAKLLFAREMGPAEDAPFLARFADRRIWLLHADERPPRLVERPGTRH